MGFTELPIALRYRSDSNNFPRDFLIPVLRKSRIYKRAVGYFSTSALIELSYGLFDFAKNGGRIQLICSPKLEEDDIDAIRFGYKTREAAMIEALDVSLTDPVDAFEEERLNLVATVSYRITCNNGNQRTLINP